MTASPEERPDKNAGFYDKSNIFAKILRREIPVISVYEDDAILAFMDAMPQAEGHVLLIPKAPCRNLLDADPQILPHFIRILQKLAQAVQQALSADGIAIMQFNEAAAGQTVFHLHFHIIPHYAGKARQVHGSNPVPPEKLTPIAAQISAALAKKL
ncbi:MAG: HIT family protein [Candidatus Tokpelaia sp.]|nr:MAG: HIT family protein [Candidatus Tokpelaia sp.]KAA6207738.1 MAG: HIT family protein [Candidatus Tokpelaia sp.]